MPTLLLIGITNILGIQILVPMGREKVVLYSEIAGAVTDLVLNAVLIPQMASVGAAIGTLAAELVVFLVQLAALRTEIADGFHSIHYGNILIGAAIGTGCSFWIKSLGFGDFLTLFVSAVLFFGLYGLFLLIRKEPLVCEIMQQVLGRFLKK